MSADPNRARDSRIAWLLYFAFPRTAGVWKHPPITLEMLLLEMEGLLRRKVILQCGRPWTWLRNHLRADARRCVGR